MKKLMRYMTAYKKEAVLAPLFKMLEASFELFVPLVMAAIIDQGISSRDIPYIWKMVGVLVLLGVIGLTCSLTAQYFSAKAATGFAAGVKSALFKHMQSLSFSEMDTLGTSTMITRMTSDMNQVQSGVNMTLRLFLRSPFIVFGAMVMAFTIDVKAALLFVVVIPVLSIVVFGIMYITMPMYKKVQNQLDKVLGITRENLTGARVIRAFGKEEQEKAHFEENVDELTRMQLYVGKLSALTNPVTYLIVNVATIALIYTGAVRVDNGFITQGQVVALVNYMSQILVELIKLANLIVTITKALACANRVADVFEITSSQEAVEKLSPGYQEDKDVAVRFEHVGLTYRNAAEESLTDIDFTVKKGQTVGIIGGTGSGKSSLVNMIPRFYDATAGRVLINGIDVKEYPLAQLRDKVGIVLQKAVLFKGSIRDNLLFSLQEGEKDVPDEKLYKALEAAQAREFVDQKEGGLDFEIAQGGKNLSGGQRQRMTIARALVRDPEILILDDSASALDFATDARLRQSIRQMEGTRTVFIVSQRASSIMHADQIIVMDDGAVAGIGTHEELLKACQVYQEIYYSQYPREVQA